MIDLMLSSGGLAGRTEGVALVAEREARADPDFMVACRVADIRAGLQAGHDAGARPTRHDVDPLRFGAALLPHIALFDVLAQDPPGGPRDFRFRLFGSRHEAEYGADLTGRTVSDVARESADAEVLAAFLDAAVDAADATYVRFSYRSRGQVVHYALAVALPLFDDAAAVSHLLVAADWRTPE